MYMAVTNEELQKEIQELKKEMRLIKSLLDEDFDLSDEAKKALREARETPEDQYVDLDDL